MSRLSKLKYYPCILIIAYTFASINRVYLFFNFYSPSLLLTLLHNVFANSIGMMNCVVYGLNVQVRKSWTNCCCRPRIQELAILSSG